MFDVFGFYKFKKLTSLKKNKILLKNFLIEKNIRGTIIIATEGINATISGKANDLKSAITKIKKILDFKKFDSENTSKSKFQPFHKPKVKIKKEVVPMGLSLSSKNKKDNHVDPKKWNKLIGDKETLVLDSRKPFEYNVGTFKRSVNPDVDNFREFPKYLNKLKKTKPIAIGFVFFSLFKYFGNSLKLSTSGLTDLLKVPTLYSNGFLESKTNVSLSPINLFHFFGST